MSNDPMSVENLGLRKGRKRHFTLYMRDVEYAALEELASRELRELRWQAYKLIVEGLDALGLLPATPEEGSDV